MGESMSQPTDRPIRVLHLTPVVSRRGGGAATYLADLVRASDRDRVQHWIAGTGDEHTRDDFADVGAERLIVGSPSLGRHMGFSRELTRALRSFDEPIDLVHAHGLRNGIGLQALREQRERRVPMLITPHGMHFPQLLRRGRLLKAVVAAAWDRRYQQRAACFHVTGELELQHLRSAGARQPAAVVPIGVTSPAAGDATPPDAATIDDLVPAATGRRIALFLAILDRKKGAVRLVQSWGRLAPPGWHLVIAGPDLGGHRAEIEQAIANSPCRGSIALLGGVYGRDKLRLMRSASLFVLPTEWESFGIVIGEALACGVPVITTRQTPWRELPSRGAGWCIDLDDRALDAALREATTLPDERLHAMGQAGKAWIERELGWPSIADRMTSLYAWLVGRASRPPFVHDPPP